MSDVTVNGVLLWVVVGTSFFVLVILYKRMKRQQKRTSIVAKFVQAASKDNFGEMYRLLEKYPELTRNEHDGYNLLMHVAGRGHCSGVECLAPFFAKDAQDERGWTALMYAVSREKSAAVARLLQGGTNPSHVAGGGITPLMLAAERGSFRIARYLLIAGAKLRVTMHDPIQKTTITALDIAKRQGHHKLVALFQNPPVPADRKTLPEMLLPSQEDDEEESTYQAATD